MERKRFLHAAVAALFVLQAVVGFITPAIGGTTGIISGTVTDPETGMKLVGVNIMVQGTGLTTVTDENGYYVITNVPPGDYRVNASLIGYADEVRRNVSVLMDITTPVDFALQPAIEEEESVVITDARPMIQRDVVPTMYLVTDTQEPMIRSNPNIIYQTPAVVSTQPGVVPDENGYPHIRGGRANQVGYMLDGIPITQPLTNGFGTNIVTVGMDKMEIYTGGYRAEYGNAISGVFNQVVKTGQTAPGFSLETLGGSSSFKGVYPQIGGGTEGGANFYVGGYLWHSELEGQEYNEVDCADAVGKFNYPIGEKNKLTLLAANGSAKFQFPYVHTETYGTAGLVSTGDERDHTHQSYSLGALTWSHTIDSSSFVTLRPYYFRSSNKVDALSNDIGFWYESRSTTRGVQLDYTNQISPKHLLKAGLSRMASNNESWAAFPAYGTYEYTTNTDTTQTGIYIQDQMTLGERWRADIGLRYDRMKYDKVQNPDSSESQYSPRLGLSYAVDTRTNLRFSYGRMIQFPYTEALERVYVDPSWEYYYGNSDLKPERCTQYDFGWERQVSDNYSLQVTPFYRKYTDLLQTTFLDPSNPAASPIVYGNLGEGTSRGIELMLRKRPSDNWSGWLSYTYSKARAHSSGDWAMIDPTVTQYVDWDQRHTISAVVNYTKNDWTWSLNGEYGSGLPYGDSNELRASPHLVFNLNVAKEVKDSWLPDGTVQFGIANLFNVGSVLDYSPDVDPMTGQTLGWVEGPRVSPRFVSLSFTRQF